MEFTNPPPQRRRRRSEKWESNVRELKANPGEWGLVGNYSPGLATHIRHGRYPSFLPAVTPDDPRRYMDEHWQVTTRKTDQGRRCDIWIKWIGGNEA